MAVEDEIPVQNTEEGSEETSMDDEKVSDKKVEKKKGKTKSKSKPVKDKGEEEEEEEAKEESSEEEEHPGLYDKPLVIEGKRERKKTVFLVKDENEWKKPEPLQFNGTGDALGTMDVVNHELSLCTPFELKPLHKLLFGRDGRANEIKKNIKSFNGFKIEEGTREYENKKLGLEKFTNEGLKRLLEILDLEKKGTRDDLKERVFTFLMNPKETGRSLKALHKKNEKKKKTGGEKRKRPSSKTKKDKKSKAKDKDQKGKDEEVQEDKEEDEEEEVNQPEEPKKKKARTESPSNAKSSPSKSQSKQKTPSKSKKDNKKDAKKKSPKAKSKPVTVKITAGKRTPKKTPVKKVPADEDSSDDEPLSKKAKKQEPTDEDLAKTVRDLLKDADLDEITVKSVSKDVFAKYPDFDLSERKGFIKETIYSVIAGDTD